MEHLAVVTACIKSTVKIYSGQLLPLTTHLDKCSELEQVLQSTVFNSHLSQSSDYQQQKPKLPAGAKENYNSTFIMWSLHYLNKTRKTMSVHLSSVSRCICIDLLSIRLSLYADSATKQNRLTFARKYGQSREIQGHLFQVNIITRYDCQKLITASMLEKLNTDIHVLNLL